MWQYQGGQDWPWCGSDSNRCLRLLAQLLVCRKPFLSTAHRGGIAVPTAGGSSGITGSPEKVHIVIGSGSGFGDFCGDSGRSGHHILGTGCAKYGGTSTGRVSNIGRCTLESVSRSTPPLSPLLHGCPQPMGMPEITPVDEFIESPSGKFLAE